MFARVQSQSRVPVCLAATRAVVFVPPRFQLGQVVPVLVLGTRASPSLRVLALVLVLVRVLVLALALASAGMLGRELNPCAPRLRLRQPFSVPALVLSLDVVRL